jgi:AcrR family transcriptional regulator
MINKDLNTEQIILEAAETEFLEKGFGNTKMMTIAKRAGVSHSMLHYYFRSKENLFQMIFQRKIQMLSQLFGNIDEQELPFTETVRFIIEKQFDLIAQNQCVPRFILYEIISDKDNLKAMLDAAPPIIAKIVGKLDAMLGKEIERGNVRPISIHDLLVNVIALNASSFVHLTLLARIYPEMDEGMRENYLRKRRESNVEFVLGALRP